MEPAQSKRNHTEEAQSKAETTNTPQTHLVEPDLFARLRGAGARVRHNVNQGYRNDYTVPIDSSALSTPRIIFRSHSDTLRDLYASNPPTSAPASVASISKRGRSHSPEGDRAESDLDMDSARSAPLTGRENSASALDATNSRPVKPLRQKRLFGKSQSLPAQSNTLNHFSIANKPTAISPIPEDDWSEDAFSSGGKTETFRPTYL